MPFRLRDVGQECFMLVFRDEDIGSVFSTEDDDGELWIATLHGHHSRFMLPAPFTCHSHRFTSLGELQDWLGVSMPAADAMEVAA